MLDTFHIEASGVPVYVQIRDQMLRAIGAGVVAPGARLPTMREVAVALKIDLNTVRHAYDALARTGAIKVLPARGTYVADVPPILDPIMQQTRLDDLAHRCIAAARAAGVAPAELAARMNELSENGESVR